VLYRRNWYNPLLYGQQGFVIEGTPLIDPALALTPPESPYVLARSNGAGEVEELRYVSAADYRAAKDKPSR
jgi:hypothetical protein